MSIFDRPRRQSGSAAGRIITSLTSASGMLLVALVTTHGENATAAVSLAQDASATAPAEAPAKAEIDPKAKEVLDRSAKASLGEYAKDRSLKNMRTKARMVMAAQGINAPMTMVIDADGNQAMTMEIPGLGKMQSGINKDMGWSYNAMMGPSIMSDVELAQARDQADLYGELDWAKRATKIAYAGESEVEMPDGAKRPAHKLLVTTRATGIEETHFFDRETGLRLRSEVTQMVPGQGAIPVTTSYMDYKKVSGLMVPHRTLVAVGPQSQEMIIESVEVNVELDEDTFEVPAEVKAVSGK
jgi:hypothetical protein